MASDGENSRSADPQHMPDPFSNPLTKAALLLAVLFLFPLTMPGRFWKGLMNQGEGKTKH